MPSGTERSTMRIALVTPEYPPTPGIGGIGTHVAATAAALARRGHEVTIVTPGEAGVTVESDVTVVRQRRRTLPAWVPRRAVAERLIAQVDIARACRRARPEVVQAPEWEAQGWLMARWGRFPFVTHLATPTFVVDELNHGRPSRDTTVVRWMEHDQARRSRLVYAPTKSIVARVAPRWGLDPATIEVVPDPVDIEGIRRLGRGDPPLSMPARVIVFNGRLERRKGIEVLGEALPSVLEAHPDVEAVLVGRDTNAEGGRLMARFRRATESVADRIHVLGQLPKAKALAVVARATLVVLPSIWENFGTVCLEAMALGRPVVASDGTGFAEVIRTGVDGWLVPPGDASALAATMLALLADHSSLARAGEAAARRSEDFHADRTAASVEALYRRAAQSPGYDGTPSRS
jgi:glycogen(starch) synthase